MGILSSDLTPEVSSSIDLTYTRDSERAYRVFATPDSDENFIRNNFGVRIGDPHPTDSQQLCVGLSVRCMGRSTAPGSNADSFMWIATAKYGPWNPLEVSPNGNPVSIPARFRFDVTTVNVPAVVDVDGDPIVNSAGDYFDPPVEREIPRVTLTVNRNESSPNPATLLALTNVVNIATWNGFPPKTVKLSAPKMPQVQYSQSTGTFYWPMEYVFEINFDTWVKQIPNRGYRELASDGTLQPILIKGQPPSDPVFLDEAGHAILTPDYRDSSGDTPPESDPTGGGGTPGGGEPPSGGTGGTGGVVINAYDVYRAYDYSQFNMNNLFTLPSVLP